jgi:hypothetical protein
MKRFVLGFWIVAVGFWAASLAFAQPEQSDVIGTITIGNTTIVFERGSVGPILGELRAFDGVLQQEPSLERVIARDPAVVNRPAFVAEHPALRDFLESFPNARDDIAANPGNFVRLNSARGK